MEHNLIQLLRDTCDLVDTNNTKYTHVTKYGPEGKWTLRGHDIPRFWLGYCDLVETRPNSNLCLAEKPKDVMPIIVECTLRFDKGMEGEPYCDSFIHILICCYQQVIIDNFVITDENNFCELICCLLESEDIWKDDNEQLVTKIRLQFSYCCVEAGLQTSLIKPKVISLLRARNVLKILDHQPLGDWETIISDVSVTEPVLMYGSESAPNIPKMIFKDIYPYINPDLLPDDDNESDIIIHKCELSKIFMHEHHLHSQQQLIPSTLFTSSKTAEFWLPLYLSINYCVSVTVLKNNPNSEKTKQYADNYNNPNSNGAHKINDDSDLGMAESLLPILSPSRFQTENYILDIGRALYNAAGGNSIGMKIWCGYLQKHNPSIDIHDYKEKYYSFINTNITVKTIGWYAQEDDGNRYSEWHGRWYQEAMGKAITSLHSDVALAVYRVFWLSYVCCTSGNKTKWYYFDDNRWVEDEQGIKLRKGLSGTFLKLFENYRTQLSKKIESTTDEAFRNNAELNMKKITQLISKLKTVTFKSNIMKELVEQFHHPKFISILDSNLNILGNYDCVFEVCNGKLSVRKGKPEDFISKSTWVMYRNDYSWECPVVKELMQWLGQVFTDKALLRHFLKFSSSCLRGRNSDKIFAIFTGDNGDNSKSMIVKLFEATLGSYCIKFPTTLITGKRTQSSAPTPELARARCARIGFVEEPDEGDPIRKDVLKHYTGGDSFFARLLNDNGGDVQAAFKLVLICNVVPTIINADKAAKNRTKLFPYLSTWVDNPPDNIEEQYSKKLFKKDPFFEDKIAKLAPAFLWVLVEYFPIYIKEGLIDPQIIKETTEAYWKDNDFYYQFTGDRIRPALDENGKQDHTVKLGLNEVYTSFKEWFRSSFPATKPPDRKVVKAELIIRWGKLDQGYWRGAKLAETNVVNIPGTSSAQVGSGPLTSDLLGKSVSNRKPILKIQ